MRTIWLCLGLVTLLGGNSAILATSSVTVPRQEMPLIRKTHGEPSLHKALWRVRRQLDRLYWDTVTANRSIQDATGYGVESENLWTERPLLPLILPRMPLKYIAE